MNGVFGNLGPVGLAFILTVLLIFGIPGGGETSFQSPFRRLSRAAFPACVMRWSRHGLAGFSASSASRPQNESFFQPIAQPQRACSGEISSDSSWPCSG